MRVLAVLAGALVATPLSAAEQMIFHTVSFADDTTIQLSVLSNSAPLEGDYDFEVAIGLVQTDANGAIIYEDSGKHRARVRCGRPAYVRVGNLKYPIDTALGHSTRDDWKEDLWKAFCAAPVS